MDEMGLKRTMREKQEYGRKPNDNNSGENGLIIKGRDKRIIITHKSP